MQNQQILEDRIAELEMTIAFQEQLLDELNHKWRVSTKHLKFAAVVLANRPCHKYQSNRK